MTAAQGSVIHNTRIIPYTYYLRIIHNTTGQVPRMGVLFRIIFPLTPLYFLEFFVPDAVRKFKQGYGRLIRSKKDFGSLICTDSRILSKNYGEEFMNCIPDYSYIQEPVLEISDHIKSWLDNHE